MKKREVADTDNTDTQLRPEALAALGKDNLIEVLLERQEEYEQLRQQVQSLLNDQEYQKKQRRRRR